MTSVNVMLGKHTFWHDVFHVVVVQTLVIISVSAESGSPLKYCREEFICLFVLSLAD
jgi:hypothetical protein